MTRTEHLDWCKKRALEYVEKNELTNAYASFTSDMQKHDETADHSAISLGMQLMMIGKLNTQSEMRKFIQIFN